MRRPVGWRRDNMLHASEAVIQRSHHKGDWKVGLADHYLGFANHPRIREAQKKAIDRWGWLVGKGEKPKSAWLELEPLKNIQVWRFALYYFFVFGAFVGVLKLNPFVANLITIAICSLINFALAERFVFVAQAQI